MWEDVRFNDISWSSEKTLLNNNYIYAYIYIYTYILWMIIICYNT